MSRTEQVRPPERAERAEPAERGASRRRGRAPALSTRGRIVAATAGALALAGLFFDRADVLGLAVALCGLLFVVVLAQYPTALFVWRRHVELAWRVERPEGDPALYTGRSLTLGVELRNRAPRSLGVATIRPIASAGLEVGEAHVATAAERDAHVVLTLTPRSVGIALLHGAALTLTDALGLTLIEAYFPSPIALPVVPRLGAPIAPGGALLAAGPERAQRSAVRLAGQGGELRELREHRPGDPWKQIAWKATARRGRLMVKELERESQTRHLLILDVSGRMRESRGQRPIDLAIEVCARYARGALDAGDPVGLVTVDGRVLSSVAVSDRAGQRRRLTEALAHATESYDEDLTEISDAELCGTVGRYLLLQEGADTRVPPPPVDDPRWGRLIAAPSGELFELDRLLGAVAASRGRSPALGAASRALKEPQAGDPHMRTLRSFCRERAIGLPPRLDAGRGLRGIAAALGALTGTRPPDRIVILSLLDGLDAVDRVSEQAKQALAESLARLSRRGVRPSFVAPVGMEPTATEDPVDVLLALDRARRESVLREAGRPLGLMPRLCRDAAHFRVERDPPRGAHRWLELAR